MSILNRYQPYLQIDQNHFTYTEISPNTIVNEWQVVFSTLPDVTLCKGGVTYW